MYIANMKFRAEIRNLKKQVDELENGDAYLKMEEKFEKRISALEYKIEVRDRKIQRLFNSLAAKDAKITDLKDKQKAMKNTENTWKKELKATQKQVRKEESEANYWKRLYEGEHVKNVELNRDNGKLKEENEDLTIENRRLNLIVGIHSGNSGLSSSKDTIRGREARKEQKEKEEHERQKKATVNPKGNSRQEHKVPGRKRGGQKGHEGHRRPQPQPTEVVVLEPPEQVRNHPEDWEETGETKFRSISQIRLIVDTTLFISHAWVNKKTGEVVRANFPSGVVNEVNYGSSIKAFACLLNNYCHVSMKKASEFISNLSDGQLNLSAGFMAHLKKEFTARSKTELDEIFRILVQSPYLHADTTYTRLDGTNAYIHICTSPEAVLYQGREKKGYAAVKGSPLELYQGILIHDHEKMYFNFGKEHQKCLVHEIRYLRRAEENEPELSWHKEMREFLQGLTHQAKEGTGFSPEEVQEAEEEYDRILEKGEKEYKGKNPKYYKEGYGTLKRLEKTKEAMLLFMTKDIPWTNNAAEKEAREAKRKTNQCDQFRSLGGLEDYCNVASVVQTAKKQGINPYKKVEEIYGRIGEQR